MLTPFSETHINTDVKSLYEKIIQQVSKRKTLLISPSPLSYGQTIEEMQTIMQLFKNNGLSKGDSIILSLENDADMTVFFLAAFRYGLITTTIDINATNHEASQLFTLANPNAVICSADIHKRWSDNHIIPDAIQLSLPVSQRSKNTSKPSFINKLFKKESPQKGELKSYPDITANLLLLNQPTEEPLLTDIAIRAFTSGSTGTPKVVSLNYDAIINQARTMAKQTKIEKDSVLLSLFQFTQLGALASGILLSFFSGSTFCRPIRKFAYQHIPLLLDSIYKERVSHFYLVPTIMDLLLRYGSNLKEAFDTPDFKYFLCMAAMLPKSLWEEFENITNKEVINSFGLTEANNLTYSGPDDPQRDLSSVGRCIDSEVKILDTDGKELIHGEQGELVIRSQTMFQEYYGNPVETDRVLKDGWFYTGDIAKIDSSGNILIIGRIKDVIISGGYNIYPEEININLREHENISEAYTLGYKSETWGEQVISCVVYKDKPLTESDVTQFLRLRLSELKVPKRILNVKSLPMNARGKIDKTAVLSIVAQHMESNNISSTSNYKQEVLITAADIFMIDAEKLTISSHYSDTPGWDSLGHMMLISAIEKRFDFKADPLDVLKIQTLGDIITMIEEKLDTNTKDIEHSF